jgi:hypothetical protein
MAPQSGRAAIQRHAIDKPWRDNARIFMPAIVTCMTVKGNGRGKSSEDRKEKNSKTAE